MRVHIESLHPLTGSSYLMADKFEGVNCISIHVSISVRNATIAEQQHSLSVNGKKKRKKAWIEAYPEMVSTRYFLIPHEEILEWETENPKRHPDCEDSIVDDGAGNAPNRGKQVDHEQNWLGYSDQPAQPHVNSFVPISGGCSCTPNPNSHLRCKISGRTLWNLSLTRTLRALHWSKKSAPNTEYVFRHGQISKTKIVHKNACGISTSRIHATQFSYSSVQYMFLLLFLMCLALPFLLLEQQILSWLITRLPLLYKTWICLASPRSNHAHLRIQIMNFTLFHN